MLHISEMVHTSRCQAQVIVSKWQKVSLHYHNGSCKNKLQETKIMKYIWDWMAKLPDLFCHKIPRRASKLLKQQPWSNIWLCGLIVHRIQRRTVVCCRDWRVNDPNRSLITNKDFYWGHQNISHSDKQQSFPWLLSPGQSDYTMLSF